MGDREPAADASAQRRQVMRIYVGGVGPAVTTADIEKTFSSLGRVTGVELVHTNDRNFAYMDFDPSSDKTLAKLFSTYNGCTWKGGKLKLEKAKEHYLDRLKREWTEDVKLISETPTDPDIKKDARNSKIERLNLEKMQLQIFFPKLRKVKALPFKGTGKHKYSFQRIEVPPLPIHFCDCEEHCEASETASNKYLSSVNSGVQYENELNIMNSVMNKLFEKESNELNSDRERILATAEKVSQPSTNEIHDKKSEEESEMDIHEEESDEESEMDADNLVTNIGMGRRDNRKMQLGGQILPVNQESKVGKSFKNELDQIKTNSKKRQKTGPADASEVTENKKAHVELLVEIVENEFSAILPRSTKSEGLSHEPEVSAQPLLNKGQTWLQKSSWKDHIGGTRNSSFSISQPHEPGIPAEPPLDKGRTEMPAEPPLGEGQTEPSTVASQSTKGQSWLQKSSWKDLVGGTGNSSFSITNVLPGISTLIPKQPKANESTIGTSAEAREIKAQPDGNKPKTTPVTADPIVEKVPADDEMLRMDDHSQADAGGEVQKEEEKASEQKPRRTLPEVGMSDVCTFMRSAESVKEWSQARAALNRKFNKKRKKTNADDSPENTNGMQPRKRRQKMK